MPKEGFANTMNRTPTLSLRTTMKSQQLYLRDSKLKARIHQVTPAFPYFNVHKTFEVERME